MRGGDVQNAIVGIAIFVIGVIWLLVDPKRLPSWLQLEKFAKHRVLFALLTMALGAFVGGTALFLGGRAR